MATQITPRTQLDSLTEMILGAKQRLAATLAGAIDARQFATAALQCVRRNPKLLECNPTSFLTALLEGAQLALQIGDGAAAEAHLVPYKGEVKLIPGYRGLLKLAYQHPRVGTINANVVYAHDAYRYQAAPPTIEHTPSANQNRGEMVAAYMQCWLVGSTIPINFWLWRHQIEAIRDKAPGAKRSDGPWHTHPDAMWVKTVIRHGCKYIPRSSKLMAAVERADPDVDTEAATGSELSPIDLQWGDEPVPFVAPTDGPEERTTPAPRPASTDKHADLRAKVRDLAADIGNDRAEEILGAIGVEGLREVTTCPPALLESAVAALQEEKMRQLSDRPKKAAAKGSVAAKQSDLIPGAREVNP